MWILLDVAIALAALAVLAVLVLGLWRKVKALSAVVTVAGERLGEATDRLAAVQADRPLGGPSSVSPAASPATSARPPST